MVSRLNRSVVTVGGAQAMEVAPGGVEAPARLPGRNRDRWGNLILMRALPACFFILLLYGNLARLALRIQAGVGESGVLAYWAYTLQQAVAALFIAVIVALFILRRPVTGRRSSIQGAVVAIGGTFALTVTGSGQVAEDQSLVLFLSSGLVLIGTIFALVSLLALGRCFGLMPEARGLVTHGPYRWVRHPVYLGEIVSALGLVVASGTPTMVALFLVFCGLQYWRTVMEEEALAEAFPEYGAYRGETYRLLPGIH